MKTTLQVNRFISINYNIKVNSLNFYDSYFVNVIGDIGGVFKHNGFHTNAKKESIKDYALLNADEDDEMVSIT